MQDVVDEALALLGTDRAAIVMPRAFERDYNLVAPLPLVDEVLAAPFQLPGTWRTIADGVTASSGSVAAAYDHALATVEGVAPQGSATPDPTPTRSAVRAHLRALWPGLDLDGAWRNDPHRADVYALVGRLASTLHSASAQRRRAYAHVDLPALEALGGDRLGYWFSAGTFDFLTVEPARMAQLSAMADHLRRVDWSAAFAAGRDLVHEVDRTLRAGIVPGEERGALFDLTTPDGRIVVGGWGDDRWDEPVAVLVDLGGADVYGDGLGGSRATPGGLTLVMDLGGDDTWESRGFGAQGAGTLGVAVVADAAGDDRWIASSQAQGSAFGGVGVLVDGGGDDTYEATFLAQGGAAFGVALHLDRGGDDTRRLDGMGQGYGSTLGMGLLHDAGGRDAYACGSWNDGERRLELGSCQGGAMGVRPYPWARDPAHHGGLGFLVDDGGDDTYDAQDHSQGGSYFLGLGALFDRAGDDTYVGHREHHQGGSMHLGAGILLDLAGNDRYAGFDSSQGAGNDRGVGFLVDEAGDDTYTSERGSSQGYTRKGNSLSVFLDAAGDDRYTASWTGKEGSQGWAQLGPTPWDQGTVVFLDLDGSDTYSGPGRADGVTWQTQPGVIGRDLVAGAMPAWSPRTPVGPAFARFSAAASPVAGSVGTQAHARDAATLAVLRGQLDPVELTAWLSHPDPTTRSQAAKLLGRGGNASGVPALVAALDSEPVAAVRAFQIEALGRLGEPVSRWRRDPDPVCRRVALASGDVGTADLVAALSDPSPSIRFVAAKALARTGDPASVPALLGLDADPDPWVRRAAAHALLAAGDERGIERMIATMGFYTLDTSSYAWGADVGNLLRQYTNAPAPGPERADLDPAWWEAWWAGARRTFRIDPLLPAARLLDEGDRLRAAKQEDEARAAYTRALELAPGYLPAQERLARP